MSKPACYRCPDHGRVPVRTAGRAAPTAPCPTCGVPMERAPHEREDLRYVAVSGATLARLKAHAQNQGMSMGAVIEALTQDLGGAA